MTNGNRFSFEQQIRSIFRDELQKFFAGSGDSEEGSDVDEEEEESISLAPLVAAKRAKAKGRGRVTNPKDGRLRANKK